MSDAKGILELANGLDDDIKFILDACEELTQVPRMFQKMALKATAAPQFEAITPV